MGLKKIVLALILIILMVISVTYAGTMDDLLLKSIAKNDIEMIKIAIANGADVNYVKKGYHTPLSLAIKKANIELASYLINNGADPNIKMELDDERIITPLIIAVQNDNFIAIQFLIESGTNINEPIGYGDTPLMVSIKKTSLSRSLEILNFLISNGADVNQPDNEGVTPLMVAANVDYKFAEGIRLTVAKVLLAAGANPTSVDRRGRTALQYAVDKGSNEMIKLLLPITPK